MKKIINGKKYDTETAKEVAYRSEHYRGDFNYISETLYKKKTGEFFIYGEGGANTSYAYMDAGNMWCGGEAIRPISENEAKAFVEANSDVETYEELFGEVAE